jgi:hypothetical protein
VNISQLKLRSQKFDDEDDDNNNNNSNNKFLVKQELTLLDYKKKIMLD